MNKHREPTFGEVATLRVLDKGERIVIKPTAHNILDEVNIEALKKGVLEIINNKPEGVRKRTFILDLSGVEHFSAVAIGTLIAIDNSLKGHGDNQLVIAGASPNVMDLFEITRMTKRFMFADTVGDAEKGVPPAGAAR